MEKRSRTFWATEFSVHLWNDHDCKRFFSPYYRNSNNSTHARPYVYYDSHTHAPAHHTHIHIIHRILRDIHARTHVRTRARMQHIHIHHSRSVATTRGSRECTRRSLSPISQEKSDERIRRRSPRRSRVTTTRCASAPFHHGWAALAFKSRRSHHDEITVADCRIRWHPESRHC